MKSTINIFISLTFFLFLFASCSNQKKKTEKPVPVTPETALKSYLNNDDQTFNWELKDEFEAEGTKIYDLLLTSQKWREFTWKHQLTIIVPSEVSFEGALLFITGGSIKDGMPNWSKQDDKRMLSFTQIASKNKAIVSIVRQTPNQPLFDGLVEDQLISYTLHKFKEDGDFTWPLLFPMVKTAVRAMDATQEFSNKNLGLNLENFTVTGASKRGWTTWLTGASDPRVKAIAPMVIDVLNMPVSLDYQIKVWNEYSEQIEDYVKLEIPQQVHTESGDAISTMVDPYSYRKSLTMPKMIFIGTNDEYWPVDAIKNYINDIPGKNFIHYVPDAGHDLAGGEQALRALSAFWANTLSNTKYPECSWEISQNSQGVELKVKASPNQLIDAYLWTATSKDRDFRDEKWHSSDLKKEGAKNIEQSIIFPESGYKAFYIDLKYKDPNGGEYTKSTRMFVVNTRELL